MIHCEWAAVRSCPSHRHADTQLCGIGQLPRGVLRTQFGGVVFLAQHVGPHAVPDQQAPVVGGADGVKQVKVGSWICGEVDVPAPRVGAGHHRGDAHIKIGIGFALAVHARKAVNQSGDDEFAGAVDDARALGNRHA